MKTNKENKWGNLIHSAIFISFAIYFREDGIIFFLILLGIFFLWYWKMPEKILQRGFVYSLIVFLFLFPWIVRNYIVFNKFIPLATANYISINWCRINIDIEKKRDKESLKNATIFLVPLLESNEFQQNGFQKILGKLKNRYVFPLIDKEDARIVGKSSEKLQIALGTFASPKQLNDISQTTDKILKKYIKTYPFSYLLMVTHRFFHYLFTSRAGDLPISVSTQWVKAIFFLFHFVFILGSLIGLLWNRKTRVLIPIVLYPFFYIAVIGWPLTRITLPVFPLLFLGFAIFISLFWEKWLIFRHEKWKLPNS